MHKLGKERAPKLKDMETLGFEICRKENTKIRK